MELISILAIAILVLGLDAAIEMGLLSSMVGYLHRSGANQYPFRTADGSIALINAKPHHLGTNEGHLSNGAAGTALVLICISGMGILLYEMRNAKKTMLVAGSSTIFLVYTVFAILSFLLTTSALGAMFGVSQKTSGQKIDLGVAAANQGHGYPLGDWAPGTWTEALLELPLTSDRDRSYLSGWLKVMKANKFNLIPLFIFGLVVAVLSVYVAVDAKRKQRGADGKLEVEKIAEARPSV